MIDDSGTGDLIGDAFIVFWRRETNDVIRKRIPLEIYQSPDFNDKSKNSVKELLIQAIDELHIPSTEEIFMCGGSIFDECRKYLSEKGFNNKTAKIEGYFQDLVEQSYVDYLVNEIGIPKNLVTVESGKERFFALFRWLTEDYPRRVRFVKSGFDKWQTKWNQTAQDDWMRFIINFEPQPSESILSEEYTETNLDGNHPQATGVNSTEGNSADSVKTIKKKYTHGPKGRGPSSHGPKKSSRSKPSAQRTDSQTTTKPYSNSSKQTHRRGEHGPPRSRDPSEPRYSSTDPNPRRRLF
jgi:hypothetical protein